MTSRHLRPKSVADLLGVTEQTLAAWRSQRRGPPFVRVEGAIRYAEEELQRYLRERSEATLPADIVRPPRLVA